METDRVQAILGLAETALDNISGDDIHDRTLDRLVGAVRMLHSALAVEHRERVAVEARLAEILPQTARRDRS